MRGKNFCWLAHYLLFHIPPASQQECSFLSTDSGATSLFIIYFLGARVLWTEGMSLARTRKNMWLASRIPSLPFLLPHIREEEAGKRFLFLISVQPLIEKKSGRDRIQTHFWRLDRLFLHNPLFTSVRKTKKCVDARKGL